MDEQTQLLQEIVSDLKGIKKQLDVQDSKHDSMLTLVNGLEKKIDEKHDQLHNQLDGLLGRMKTDEEERAALSAEVERHGKRLRRLEPQSG
ncbi:hypothetical protein AB0D86_39855 [Streptomyces sp. NPDC048324]|uniref:hypothetical protein n=1 Tax=Streptomyces sp. NPDC048324 TaxID=3157205 RepID=UPI00343A0475